MTSLVFVTMIYLIITEMMIKGGHIGAGLLLLIFFIGVAVVLGLQGYSQSLKQRLTNQHSASNKDLLNTGATMHLDPHREPTNSVTEHTTELLPAQSAPRRVNTKEV